MNCMRRLGLATLVAMTLWAGVGCSKTPVVTDGHLAPSPRQTSLDLKAFQPTTDSPPSGRDALIFDVSNGLRTSMKDAIIWNHSNHQVGTVVAAKHLQASISVRGGQSSVEALASADGFGEFLAYKAPKECEDDGDIKAACYVQAVFRDVAGTGAPKLLLAVGDGLTNLKVNVFEYQGQAPEGKRWSLLASYDGQTVAELEGTTLSLPYGGQGLFEAHDLQSGPATADSAVQKSQVFNESAVGVSGGLEFDVHKDFKMTFVCSGSYASGSQSQPIFPRSGEALVTAASEHGAIGVGIRLNTWQMTLDSNPAKGIITRNLSDETKIDLQKNDQNNSMEHVVLDRRTGKLTFIDQFPQAHNDFKHEVLDMVCKTASDEDGRAVLTKWQEKTQASMDDVQRYAVGLTGSLLHGGACDSLSQVMVRTANAVQVPENVRMARLDALLKSAEQAHCLMQ